MNLYEEVQNDIVKYGLQQKDIAKKIGVSAQSLSYYLQQENQFKFITFYELLMEVYSDKSKDFIIEKLKQFILVTKKRDNYKECLEWSYKNGERELFELVLKKEEEVNGNEIVKLYQMAMRRLEKSIDPEDLLFNLGKEVYKQKESIAFAGILELWCLYDTYNYSSILLFTRSIREKIKKMKKGYLKEAYEIRLEEIELVARMKNGDIENSITKAKKMIEIIDERKFPHNYHFMFSLLAELYLFSNPRKSVEYIEKAISLYKTQQLRHYEFRINALLETRDFMKIFSGDFEGLTLNSHAEKAHYYARIGKKEKSLEILNEMKKTHKLTPFQLYYKYLATGNEKDKELAEKAFYKAGDYHYSDLLKKCEKM